MAKHPSVARHTAPADENNTLSAQHTDAVSQITVAAGQTYTLPALLASSTILTAAPGTAMLPGALLKNAAGVTSSIQGDIVLQGGSAASGAGATLQNSGTLNNSGQITAFGGQSGTGSAGGLGATLTNTGVLTNAAPQALIKLGGGYSGFGAGTGGSGALLSNTGVLTNDGTLFVEAGFSASAPSTIEAATLIDTGLLANNAKLWIQGSYEGARITVTATGLLTNTGAINIFGSDLSPGVVSTAALVNDGTVINTGAIYIDTPGLPYGGFNDSFLDAGLLTNNGQIGVGYGTLSVSGMLANQGTISLHPHLIPEFPISQLTIASTGTLLNTGAITGLGNLVNDGTLAGQGAVTDTIAVATLTNDGTIVSGAAMQITGAISAAPGLSGQIEVSAGGTLSLNGPVSASETVTFDSATGQLTLATPSSFAAPIDGFAAGDVLDLTGLAFATGHMSESFANGVLTVSDGVQTDSFILDGVPDGTLFRLVPDGTPSHGTTIEEAALCFAHGTRLRTDRGDVAVEDLAPGDRLITLHGGAKPIRWIGRRGYDGRFIAGNHLMLPVCIKADALSANIPLRDVTISPGHGIYLDGVLVPAWRLVNGVTITQAAEIDRIDYIHVELAEHEIVCASGLHAETYLDQGCRSQFANAAAFLAAHPDHEAELRPTDCVPRIEDGFQLQSIQQRLAARAQIATPPVSAAPGALNGYLEVAGPDRLVGWARDVAHPEQPVCLDVLVDGRRVLRLLANRYRADVRAAGLGSGCHGFDLRLPDIIHGHIALHRSTDGALLARVAADGAGQRRAAG